MDRFLLAAGYPQMIIPTLKPARKMYYRALDQYSVNGTAMSFLMFIVSTMTNTLKVRYG